MTPNAFDAAFAAAGLGNRIQCASVNTLTRISLAAMEVAQLEAHWLAHHRPIIAVVQRGGRVRAARCLAA